MGKTISLTTPSGAFSPNDLVVIAQFCADTDIQQLCLDGTGLVFTASEDFTENTNNKLALRGVPGLQQIPGVGWFTGPDNTIILGAALAEHQLPVNFLKFLAAPNVPVQFTDKKVTLSKLREAEADEIVKVLAPMGFIFDAHSPWA